MSEHTKQVRINPTDLIVTITGSLAGEDYGAVIDIKQRKAKWDASIPKHEPADPRDQPQESKKAEDCPGCRKGLWKLVKGGMGWAKEALRIGQVSETTAAERKAICLACPSNCYDFGVCRDDWPDRTADQQGCGCILALKVTQAAESCPHSHWTRTDA